MDRLTKGNGECSWALHNGLWLEPYELALERDNVHTIGNLMRRLAKYENTDHTPEEIQNAIFLPCNVGDTVYIIVGTHIYKGNVTHWWIDESGLSVSCMYNSFGMCMHSGEIGKTVFLTREETEAALGGDAT